MHWACEKGLTEGIDLLITAGADIEAKDNVSHMHLLLLACLHPVFVSGSVREKIGVGKEIENSSFLIVMLDPVFSPLFFFFFFSSPVFKNLLRANISHFFSSPTCELPPSVDLGLKTQKKQKKSTF